MKRLFFCLALLVSSFLVQAQFMKFAEGPVFPVPGQGFVKLLQLKDYTTIYFHVSSDTIRVQVYEPKYRARTEETLVPAYGQLEAGNVAGIFEENGDAVLMVTDAKKIGTVLYRLVVDGKTGKLKDEKQLVALKKNPGKKNPKATGTEAAEIAVRRDPVSENYAVAMFRPFESDTSKRVEIVLYNKDNKEINRGTYIASTEKYKYIQFLDMIITGEKVSGILYGYNIDPATTAKTGDLILATLNKGQNSIAFTELDYSNDLQLENAVARMDPGTKRILLVSYAKLNSETDKYKTFAGYIDLDLKKLVGNEALGFSDKFKTKYADATGNKSGYAGIPQNVFIQADGLFNVVYEEMEAYTKDADKFTVIRNPAVVTYNRDLQVQDNSFVVADQLLEGVMLGTFYQSARDISGQYFLNGNEFKSSYYINDGHNSFILFNDRDENMRNTGSGKTAQFKSMDDADAFYVNLKANDIDPLRKYMFGKPAEGENHHPVIFNVSDYDNANNILVTLFWDKAGTHPGYKLVWLQP